MNLGDQPIDDGDLVLRRWLTSDVEQALQDAETARWFDVPSAPPSRDDHAAWVADTHDEWADSRSKATFLVEWPGGGVGRREARRRGCRLPLVGRLRPVPPAGPGQPCCAAPRRLRFTELGLRRVEAHVNPLNRASLHVALRAGLRGRACCAGTPDWAASPTTPSLGRLKRTRRPARGRASPRCSTRRSRSKRAIAQGVLRNERGEVLLCELAYKREWDLPVVSSIRTSPPPTASPERCGRSSGIAVGLLAVDWMPPWLGWRDAVLLVFDLGTSPSGPGGAGRSRAPEIRALHWADESVWSQQVALYNDRLLRAIGRGDPRVT